MNKITPEQTTSRKSIAHLVVGKQGTGKTTFIKNMIAKANPNALLIYDVNNEYSEFYPEPFVDMEAFLAKAGRHKNTIQVYEEATIFFGTRASNAELRKMIVGMRHTGNTFILAFHSLRSVPVNVYELCNYITLFKTNDAENRIDSKFDDERLTRVFREVKDSPDPHKNITMAIK